MTESRESKGIVAVPMEMSKVIPKFDGDEKLLNLYIKKCEYVLNCYKSESSQAQNLYMFHVLSSKLVGKAAQLLSERQDIESWTELKTVLIQYFGDPRSEECIAIELETLKINNNESYLDFCNRIQQVKSTLIAKVNTISDLHVKKSKITIYDNLALNVFLYNLPEDLIRIVRLKGSSTLENALSTVLEEVNFQFQYNARNKMFRSNVSKPQLTSSQNPYVEKFGLKPFLPSNNNGGFRFGSPNQFRMPSHPQGLNSVQQFKFGNPPQGQTLGGFRPPTQNFRFGIPNQGPQGYRPNFNQAPQGYRPNFSQAPQGYRPNFSQAPQQRPAFNQSYQNQFKFGVQPPPKPFDSDVTMRTALPASRPNKTFNNEIEVYTEADPYCCDYDAYNTYCDYDNYDNDPTQVNAMNVTEFHHDQPLMDESNFQILASDTAMK
ncbi:uncharacterized protein LOC123723369 [Papilio machaon]|uniref:uncharacterized protein LOC123723369 n=1 Tax=Papilio machaon TaxID=76193 RepID=UPI001E6632FA|nr:uncharacterized protein LOC123723369 [Papilio machaon]